MSSAGMRPTIGLVIPTWNRSEVIARALESVIGEGFDEIVVADDGSTDDTEAVVARYPTVRYIRHEHAGANASRNLGALEISTEFVTFLDSDDMILPGFIAAYRAALSTGVDAVSSGYVRETPNGRRRHFGPEALGPAFDNQVGCFLHGGTYAIRRRVFWDSGGFDETMPSSQHTELALRLLNMTPKPRFAVLSGAHCVYFSNRADGIRADPIRVGKGAAALLRKHADELARDPKRFSDHAGVACRGALIEGNGTVARQFAMKAIRATPTRGRAWGRLVVSLLPAIVRNRLMQHRQV